MKNNNPIKTDFNTQNQMILIALLFISFLVAFFPVWRGLVYVWYGSDDYSHGFFILIY